MQHIVNNSFIIVWLLPLSLVACVEKPQGIADSSSDTDLSVQLDTNLDSGVSNDTFAKETGLTMDTDRSGLEETGNSIDTMDSGEDSGDIEEEPVLSTEEYIALDSGWSATCGITTVYELICWGDPVLKVDYPPPAGFFKDLSSNCVLTLYGGEMICWGGDTSDLVKDYPVDGSFVEVDDGYDFGCAVSTDTSILCWGRDNGGKDSYGQVTNVPITTGFTYIATGYYHACALDEDGIATCWGSNEYGESSPPADSFLQLTAGEYFTCGIKTDGSITCWGHDGFYELLSPPTGLFTDIDAGRQHACAIERSGDVYCWGADGNGESSPPSGEFVKVACGLSHSCGIQVDGHVQCWGNDGYGQSTPP